MNTYPPPRTNDGLNAIIKNRRDNFDITDNMINKNNEIGKPGSNGGRRRSTARPRPRPRRRSSKARKSRKSRNTRRR